MPLTAEQEKAIARDILACEAQILELIQDAAPARQVLDVKPKRAERTRAGRVDRLENALDALTKAAKADPQYATVAKQGRRLWDEAEEHRWRLAMSGTAIARAEARKLSGPFMDDTDLMQEGYIGLLRAAKRFDPDRDIRFSTYARWWVRAQMTRAIDHTGRPVRLPGCAVEQTRNLRKARTLFERSGETYTIADLAKEVGIDEDRATFLLSRGNTISLEDPVEGGRKPRTVSNFLSDDSAEEAYDEMIHAQELKRMWDGLQNVLSERHRYVLVRRYGLEDETFRTLSEVGCGMNLSRERVRQIEREALRRLRDYARIREHNAA